MEAYAYFQDGRRYRSTHIWSGQSEVRLWVWDGQDLLLESDQNLVVQLRLTHDGQGMSESLALRLPSSTGGLSGGFS